MKYKTVKIVQLKELCEGDHFHLLNQQGRWLYCHVERQEVGSLGLIQCWVETQGHVNLVNQPVVIE